VKQLVVVESLGFARHTWPLLVLDEAWLETRVVVPTVVSKVEPPSVRVETIGDVTVVWKLEVASVTLLVLVMVVSPVSVVVAVPLVKTEVQVLVVTPVAVVVTGLPVGTAVPWSRALIGHVFTDQKVRNTYTESGLRGKTDSGNTGARAEVVVPANGHIDLVDVAADRL
jgi:hypothetical protein